MTGAKQAWRCALELDEERRVVGGSTQDLCRAVARGADLRIYTEFRHHEHIEPGSPNHELIQEVSDFRITYLLDSRWVGGIMNLRMPINPPEGFGPRPSLSFFMYNQDGRQAIARPFLDGTPADGELGPAPPEDHSDMPRYHQIDAWDADTNAPSSNFIYDFGAYRFLVRDEWSQVLACNSDGEVLSGSLDDLVAAFTAGAEVKVAVRGLCADLGEGGPDHEVVVHCGPCYYNTERRVFSTGTQPVVRVRPAIPLVYQSGGWDFGSLMTRSDGYVARWLCNPYTLRFSKSSGHYPIRWFVR